MNPLAIRVVQSLASASADVIARVATRIGTSPTVGAITSAIKNNLLLAGYAAYELFGPNDEDVKKLGQDKVVGTAIDLLISSLDFKGDSGDDLETLNEELHLLEEMSSLVGGFNNLKKLRNALALDQSVWRKQEELLALGYRR